MKDEDYQKFKELLKALNSEFYMCKSIKLGIYSIFPAGSHYFSVSMLGILEKFQNINPDDLNKMGNLNSLNASDTSPFFKKEYGNMYIHHNLGMVIFHFLVHSYSNSIARFLEILSDEESTNEFLRWEDEKKRLYVNRGISKRFCDKLCKSDRTKFVSVWDLFNRRGSKIIYNLNAEYFVIETEIIKKQLMYLKHYDFDKILKNYQYK